MRQYDNKANYPLKKYAVVKEWRNNNGELYEEDDAAYDTWKEALEAYRKTRGEYRNDADVRLESRRYNEGGEYDFDWDAIRQIYRHRKK